MPTGRCSRRRRSSPFWRCGARRADVAVLGFEAADPGAYGRLILGGGDQPLRIVEARDASAEELRIASCNSGVLAASASVLWHLLGKVGDDNARHEYYLTDIVGLAAEAALSVRATFAEEAEVQGSIPRPSWRRRRRPSSVVVERS